MSTAVVPWGVDVGDDTVIRHHRQQILVLGSQNQQEERRKQQHTWPVVVVLLLVHETDADGVRQSSGEVWSGSSVSSRKVKVKVKNSGLDAMLDYKEVECVACRVLMTTTPESGSPYLSRLCV